MKFAATLFCLATLAAAISPASAQYNGDRGGPPGTNGGLPGGSWIATCRRPQMNGPNLMAQCEDMRGRMRDTSIDIRSCSTGTVANRDGGLVCEAPASRDGGMPGGSWVQSCRGGQMAGPVLRAQCLDARGRPRDTNIDVRTCSNNRLANRDGGLICE